MAGYIALVHKDEGTSYGVSFPDVPGCISACDTLEDAIENAAEALAGHLALMRADGDVIPAPRSFEELRRDPSSRCDRNNRCAATDTRRSLAAVIEIGRNLGRGLTGRISIGEIGWPSAYIRRV